MTTRAEPATGLATTEREIGSVFVAKSFSCWFFASFVARVNSLTAFSWSSTICLM